MPARKPQALIQRHDTNPDREARAAAESSLAPTTELSEKVPSQLNNHKTAQRIWKRTIGLFHEIDGRIITAFDQDILVDYCLVCEELLDDIPDLYAGLMVNYRTMQARVEAIGEGEDLVELLKILERIIKEIKGIDARKDVKRKLAHTLRQSLYLTPRSRAGVAPPEKEPSEPESEMDKLLAGPDDDTDAEN